MRHTGGSRLYTLWIVLVLATLLPLLRLWLAVVPAGRGARTWVRRCARAVVVATGCPVTVTGLEHIPEGGAMLVCNHASMADAAFLLAALPIEFWFVAHAASGRYPVLGLAVRRASYTLVDRASWRDRARCGEAMVKALSDGLSLLVFPEGTFADDDRVLPFRSGAFRAAALSGAAIVPVVLLGTRQMFPSQGALQRTPIRIEVLPPLYPSGPSRDEIKALRDAAADAIRARLPAPAASATPQ